MEVTRGVVIGSLVETFHLPLVRPRTKSVCSVVPTDSESRMFVTRRQIQRVREIQKVILAVSRDAEERQFGDEQVKDFFENIKIVAYEVEDLLDELFMELKRLSLGLHQKLLYHVDDDDDDSYLKNKNTVRSLSSTTGAGGGCFNFISVFSSKMDKKINTLRKSSDHIEIKWSKLFNTTESIGFEELFSDLLPPSPRKSPMTNNYVVVDDDELNFAVYGRDSDKDIIVKKLLSSLERETATGGLNVVPIVGMGGIGKTTLAKLVFNDDKVKSHFQTRIWVKVPQTSDQVRFVKRIIEAFSAGVSVDKMDDDVVFRSNDENDLLSLLNNFVKQNKFLLVLDDFWDDDIQKWQALKHSLQSGAQGSSVLVTTRNKRAAYLTSTTSLHELRILSEEESFDLFREQAFRNRNEQDERKALEDIGRKVVGHCGGLPLAIITLGRLLGSKRTKQDWLHVMESDKWDQLEMEPILPALLYSYYDLPSYLKRCFTYTAIFPKNYKINKDMLIGLWIAEGFLGSSTSRDKDLEMIGEEVFQELMMRSFIQDLEKDKNGNITHFKMHDLIHDLAVSMMRRSAVEIDNTKLKTSKVRHLSISNTDLDSVLLSVCKAKNLSTLKLFDCRLSSQTLSPRLFNQLKRLRALDLSFLGFEKISSEVGELKHLRYLNLSCTNLERLPGSLCNLSNLETLILDDCGKLFKLPNRLRELPNLRHLSIQNTPRLHYLPQGIARLIALQTLSKFIVHSGKGGCNIGELKDLNKLRGSICIEGLCKVKNLDEANEAGLMNKEYLHDLVLFFSTNKLENVTDGDVIKMESVLKGLQPNPNLKGLTINLFPGSKFPSWMVSESILCNLRSLNIQDCKNCIKLPALGKLPSLQKLCIRKLNAVKDIGNEFYGIGNCDGVGVAFPVLKELCVLDMANLEQWDFIVRDEKVMPSLRYLHLQACPKLISLPHVFPDALRNLYIRSCPKLSPSAFEKLNLLADKECPSNASFTKHPPKQSQVLSASQFQSLVTT